MRPTRTFLLTLAVAAGLLALPVRAQDHGHDHPPADTTPASPEAVEKALAPKPSDIGMGDPNAKVKWVEYASLGCSHCAEVAINVLPTLKTEYIDTGKVYFVMRDFPLDGVSAAATLLTRCGDTAKYYERVDLFFREQENWHSPKITDFEAALLAMAEKAGLTKEQAEACLKDQGKFEEIKAILTEASEVLKIAATPTNFINGAKIEGAAPVEEFRKALDAALAK